MYVGVCVCVCVCVFMNLCHFLAPPPKSKPAGGLFEEEDDIFPSPSAAQNKPTAVKVLHILMPTYIHVRTLCTEEVLHACVWVCESVCVCA